MSNFLSIEIEKIPASRRPAILDGAFPGIFFVYTEWWRALARARGNLADGTHARAQLRALARRKRTPRIRIL